MKRLALAGLLLAAGCSSSDEWRWKQVAWEHQPLIRRSEDVVTAVAVVRAKASLTLDECWRLALERSESFALTGEELVRLQTTYEQAVSAVLPRVSFRASWTQQDEASSSSAFALDERRAEYKVVARQPIFTGLREVYLIRQAGASFEAKEHDLRQARLNAFVDVAEAFYAVKQAGRELETTTGTLKLADERLEELSARQKSGMSRRSEVLAQEAEAASTRAQVERLKGALSVAWEALRFATGVTGTPALDDTLVDPAKLPAVEALVDRARAGRHDLKSLQSQIAAAREGRGISRAGYLPTASVEGNYYTHREGSESDWDMTLSVELPLFEGGATQAKLRETDSLIRSASLRLSELDRRIGLEVRRAHSDVLALKAQLESLSKAVASAEENHQLAQAEYRQGIATNLEVLTSFTTLQRVQLDRDRATTQLKLSVARLAVESGVLPGELR